MRLRPVVALLLTLAFTATACEFEGVHDLPLPGREVSADEAIKVTVDFHDVLNVVPRSPVKVGDVTVGEVAEVDRVGWNARLLLHVREDVVLPANAVADIRQVSLLGEKFVALEPPPEDEPTGRLGDGDSIDLASTGRNPEVEEVLGALSMLLAGGGVGQIQTISRELNAVMSGRHDRLRTLLRDLDTLVGGLDEQKEDIVRALEAVDDLTATLEEGRDTLTEAIDTLGPAARVLADQHEQLTSMLEDLDELGRVGTRVVNATSDDVLAVLRHLRPVLSRLNEAGDSFPRGLALMISFPFPKEASDVVKGDYANTSIALDIRLDNLFQAVGMPDLDGLPLPEVPEVPGPDLPPTPDLPTVPDLLPQLTGRDGALGGLPSGLLPRRQRGDDRGVVGNDGGLLGGGLGQ
ncbi:MAG: MCE family protein [Nocardioides sp.]|nr:MCE family protein [Nocardioides sp.]